MKTRKAFLILAAVTAATTSVYADKVTLDQAPASVQQAIRSRAGRHAIEDIDRDVRNGQTTYEASWKDNNGAQQELLLSENGQILHDVPGGRRGRNRGWSDSQPVISSNLSGFTNAQTAPLNWASETVQNQLKTMANGAGIDNFQKGQFQGRTAYEASYKTNGNTVSVVLGEDGSVLASSAGAASTGVITTRPSGVITTRPGRRGSIAGFANAQSAPMYWASENVQNRFKQMANGTEVQNFQKGQYQGRTAYMGTISQNGQVTTAVIGEDGSVLATAPTAVGAPGTTVTGSASGK
jgi:hypothetical protein